MTIEKAFAIRALPEVIYDALERDLADASAHDGSTFEVLRRDRPRRLDLRVTVGGMPCWLSYRLEPRDGYTEVAADLTPFGLKHALFRIMTFGLREQGFVLPVVQGLANLKAEVEGGASGERSGTAG